MQILLTPYCSPYIFYGTSKKNLTEYQDTLSLAITFFIFITWMFKKVDIWPKEKFRFRHC